MTEEKEKKIQDISEEKGAPKTTKQRVTLTKVAAQKVQEKSLNGNTGYKEESSEEAPVLILSRQSYRLYNSPNHDYKQTKTLPVIMIVFKPVWQM